MLRVVHIQSHALNLLCRWLCRLTPLFLLIGPNWGYCSQQNEPPKWVSDGRHPDQSGDRFYVGCAYEATSRQAGLRSAQANALEEIATREFPNLLTIKVEGRESLNKTNTQVEQTYESRFEKINWTGLQVEQEYIEPRVGEQKTFKVCKLLKWSIGLIGAERKRLLMEEQQGKAASILSDAPIGDPSKPTGKLKITTSPPGANILLDGEQIGRSNTTFNAVAEGVHDLTIFLDGFQTQQSKIVVTAGTQRSEHFLLAKVKGSVQVSSVPSGATVYLNSVFKGETPLLLTQEKGRYDIKVELPDYYSGERKIDIDERESEEVFTLKVKPAKMSILSTPSGATVFVDNKPLDRKTPVFNYVLPGGEHTVRISKDGFVDATSTVSVFESKGRTVNVTLTSLSMKERVDAQRRKKEEEVARVERTKLEELRAHDPGQYIEKSCELGDKEMCGRRESLTKYRALKSYMYTSVAVFGASALYALYANHQSEASYATYVQANTGNGAIAARKKVENYDAQKVTAITLACISAVAGLYFWHGSSNMSTELTVDDSAIGVSTGIQKVASLALTWNFNF